MANEIQLTVSAKLTNGNLSDSFAPGSINITQGAAKAMTRDIAMAVAAAAFTLSDITTFGLLSVFNLDLVNFITLGPDNGAGAMAPYVKVKPGESYTFRLVPGITLWGKADTAICSVQLKAWND